MTKINSIKMGREILTSTTEEAMKEAGKRWPGMTVEWTVSDRFEVRQGAKTVAVGWVG
jgi:hypothetical protein